MPGFTLLLDALYNAYPEAGCELDFQNAFEILIATILAAQCTDKQVNKVTPALFARFPNAAAFAGFSPEALEPWIHSCGFFRMKALHIVETCKVLVDQYGGEVPGELEELRKLPGVGRKTANVVYANAFGGDAIAVDTHVFRVSNRLGLATAKTPEKTEDQLMENIPKAQWSAAHHWLIQHGRRVCSAQRPHCTECPVAQWCRYYQGVLAEPSVSSTKTREKP